MTQQILNELVAMSNRIGHPELDLAILGEGNTSARADAGTFYVKASGHELRTITEQGFVHAVFERVLQLLDCGEIGDQAVIEGLDAAKLDPAKGGHPSVETLLHAICLNLEGVNFVAHTHPVAINSLTCSVNFEVAFSGRLFPDEIVVCGPAPLLVPYTDPGIPLARKVKQLLAVYLDQYGETPKVVLLQNHGLIALGRSPQHVENVTAMAVKAARILLGTYAAGGPNYLSQKDVARIHSRPDEEIRRKLLILQ
jgi:rhamnose utilization protein RhaD (predicted bifunctional aldolase and dehydrogenase)